MRIAVDAMGSDDYPKPDVAGSIMAAREWGDTMILVGDQDIINAELAKHNTNGLQIEVVHASEAVTMHDTPSDVVRGKPDSSMHVGMQLVTDGKADAFVTAGNTGAVLSVGTLGTLRRIKGVKRAALTAVFPNLTGLTIMLDFGANADAKPDWLAQFALMGSIYAERGLGIDNPRVALLSNGEEEGKGNQLIHETIPLMRQLDINYVGNMEPKEVLRGETDVIVHDGFTGNIMGKTLESMGSMINQLIRQEIRAGLITTIGGLLARPAFRRVGKRVDPFEVGGIPLLGLNGVVIVAHGRSNEVAIKNAIRQARRAVEGNVVNLIREGISQTPSSAPSES